jgi:hypothetical protein
VRGQYQARRLAADDGLVLDRGQHGRVVVSLVDQSGATCASDADAGDDAAEVAGSDGEHADDCAELELAPSVIDLPVTNAVVSQLAVTIPAGTYSALEAKIRAVRGGGEHGRGSSTFLAANPSFAGVSVRVEGTYNGTPFVYTGSPTAQLETKFSPALVADASPVNLTVNVDLSTWFRTPSGALIDPSTANAGGLNAATVADNIRRSFRAFRDNDRNGHDDDDRNGR